MSGHGIPRNDSVLMARRARRLAGDVKKLGRRSGQGCCLGTNDPVLRYGDNTNKVIHMTPKPQGMLTEKAEQETISTKPVPGELPGMLSKVLKTAY